MLSTLFAGEPRIMDTEQIRYLHAMGIEPWQLNNNQNNAQTVVNMGRSNAKLMVIDVEPSIGRAGQLFNAMLESIGLARENVHIATTADLAEQIALIKPTLLLALGQIPAHFLLETKTPLEQLRGKIHTYGLAKTPLIITYHPAYLLRNPSEKNKAFHDLQLAQRSLIG